MPPDWRSFVAANPSPYVRANFIAPLLRQEGGTREALALFDALLDAMEEGLMGLRAKFPGHDLPAFTPSHLPLRVALERSDDPWAPGF